MNIIKTILVFSIFVFPLFPQAQHPSNDGPQLSIWLTNCDKEAIKENGLAPLKFFEAEKVNIGSSDPAVKTDPRFYIIIKPEQGMNRVFNQDGALMPEKIRQEILKQNPARKFLFQEKAKRGLYSLTYKSNRRSDEI